MCQIRKVIKTDIEALAELERMCFSTPWSQQSFSEEIDNDLACFFVATVSGQVVGYVGFLQVVDEADITNIAVNPNFRRCKIGSKLMDRLIETAVEKGLKKINLEVRKSNFAAQNLYDKFGFLPVGERKNFYRKPTEDAIIMTKMLGDL